MSARRESAHTLVQRLRATHVRLLPSIFHNACGSGLRHGDVLVVGGPPDSGKTSWAYRVAAHHLLSGGSVTFLYLPGSGTFLPRRFLAQLGPTGGGGLSPAALSRLAVVHCADLSDVAAFCAQSPSHSGAAAAVPLVVVEGCGGRGAHAHHRERAAGRAAPLCDWLCGRLQRQHRCALVLVEEWAGEWETGSDVLRRLPREQGAAGSGTILESLRVFLLHVQVVEAKGKHAVSVAKLMKMNVVDTHVKNAEAEAEVTGVKRWRQRRQADLHPQLNAELLCAAQI